MAQTTDDRLNQLTESANPQASTTDLGSTPTIVVRPDAAKDLQPTEWDFTTGNVIDDQLTSSKQDVDMTLSPSFDLLDPEPIPESVFTDAEPIKVAGLFSPKMAKEIASVEGKIKQTQTLQKRLKAVEDTVTDAYLLDDVEQGQDFVFNINKISDDASLSAWMETNAKALKLETYNPISYKKIAAKYNTPEYAIMDGDTVLKITSSKKVADNFINNSIKTAQKENKAPPNYKIMEQTRYSQEFIDSMLDPSLIGKRGKTIANPEEVFKQFHFFTTVSKLSYQKGLEIADVLKVKGSAGVTNEMRLEFQQLVLLEGILSKKLKGVQVDLARSLGILNEARKAGDVSVGRMTEEALDNFGGPKKIDRFITAYVAEKDALKRTKLAEVLTKPWYKRVINIIPVTFVNGLLSGFGTQVKNILGFSGLSTTVKVENFVAVGVGKTRTYLFRGDGSDAMHLEQAIAAIQFRKEYWKKAWSAFYDSFKGNAPRDRATKFDYASSQYQDAFKYDVPLAGKPIEYLGIYNTLPGKFLQSEDEFMKSLSYWHEIEIQATGIMVNKRKELIKAGMSSTDADIASKKLFDDLMSDPTEEMVEAAIQQARYLTNTQPLTGWMKTAESLFNNPVMKLHGLFMRVTTNLIGAASERNPLTAALTPRVWKNFQAGGVKRDMAISRLITGSTFMYGMGNLAMEGKITGAGPYRYEDKLALEKAGWQQYSFVFVIGSLPQSTIDKLSAITKVKITKDKIFISYVGLEPLSLLIAQAATMGELARLNNDNPNGEYDTSMEELFGYGVQGASQYVADQPLLNGMGGLMKMFTSYETGDEKFAQILENVVETYSGYVMGGNPVGQFIEVGGEKQFVNTGNSSFWRNMEKAIYPERSELKAPEEMRRKAFPDTGFMDTMDEAWLRGTEKAVEKLCAANALCSENLPYALDPITGEPQKNGMGNVLDVVSPFKASDGTRSEAYTVIMEYGANVVDPVKDYGVYEGIQLSRDQVLKIVKTATKGRKLEKSIVELGKSFKSIPYITNEDKADLITATQSAAYRSARDELVATDRSIQRELRAIEREKKYKDKKSYNILRAD